MFMLFHLRRIHVRQKEGRAYYPVPVGKFRLKTDIFLNERKDYLSNAYRVPGSVPSGRTSCNASLIPVTAVWDRHCQPDFTVGKTEAYRKCVNYSQSDGKEMAEPGSE